ncbi:MAG: hypothetical protein JSR21_05175 [Proteobacteria bacterium]|nr:hypothetical protein [Pseudomonadota bacterium]
MLAGAAPDAFAQKTVQPPAPGSPSSGAGRDQGDSEGAAHTGKKASTMRLGSIDVIHASFGARFDQNPCDVTSVVRRRCQDRASCSIPVDERLCPNPGPGIPPLIPLLSVSFRCATAQKARTQAAEKPFALRIECGTGGK